MSNAYEVVSKTDVNEFKKVIFFKTVKLIFSQFKKKDFYSNEKLNIS